MSVRPEKSWVSTLFAPPILRATRAEYHQILREPALRDQLPPIYTVTMLSRATIPLARRLRACRLALERQGWRPYERWRRFSWDDEDELTILWSEEGEEKKR